MSTLLRRSPDVGASGLWRSSGEWRTYLSEAPGVSAFVLENGVVYHTYSAYCHGLDSLLGMYRWFDRARRARNESGTWWRHHDEFEGAHAGRSAMIR